MNAVFLTTFVIGFPYMMFLFKPSLPEDLCISRDSLDILTCAGGRSILPFDILYFVSFCFVSFFCILLMKMYTLLWEKVHFVHLVHCAATKFHLHASWVMWTFCPLR